MTASSPRPTIVADPSATGERLIKAEKLSNELPSIQERIDDRTAEVQRIAEIKGRLGHSQAEMNAPQRTLPFSATMGGQKRVYEAEGASQFRPAGYEDAGSSTFPLRLPSGSTGRWSRRPGPGS